MFNRKQIGIVILICVILALYFLSPLKEILSRENLDNLRLWIQQQGALSPLIFVLIYVAAAIFCLPGSVFTILSGLIFGIFWGTLLVIIGSNLGALITFFISRFLGRETAEKLLRGRLETINKGIETHGFHVVLWLRLVPLIPFNALNYALGLSRVRLKDCLAANFLGMLPGTFVFVSLGNAASKISLTDPRVWTKIEVWGPFLLIIFLSFLPKIFKKKQKELEKITRVKAQEHAHKKI